MAQHSPYTPGELATDVPGRESQLAAISERLAYMTGLRRLIGRIRLDQGPRGVGKTSLLAAAQRRAQQLGMLPFGSAPAPRTPSSEPSPRRSLTSPRPGGAATGNA